MVQYSKTTRSDACTIPHLIPSFLNVSQCRLMGGNASSSHWLQQNCHNYTHKEVSYTLPCDLMCKHDSEVQPQSTGYIRITINSTHKEVSHSWPCTPDVLSRDMQGRGQHVVEVNMRRITVYHCLRKTNYVIHVFLTPFLRTCLSGHTRDALRNTDWRQD